jgi:hypothetical protein
LTALGEDIFRYFGLGCRNVSKFLFKDILDAFFEAIFEYQDVIHYENTTIMITIKQFFNE